jgi:hypothetical protein
MGKYENELRQIISEGPWSAPNSDTWRSALYRVECALSDMSHLDQTGWSGATGDAARAAYHKATTDYRNFRHDLEAVDLIFTEASAAWQNAAQSLGGLPSTVIPKEVHDAVNAAASNGDPSVVIRGVAYVTDGAIDAIENLFGNNRENTAKAALASMRADLQNLSAKLPGFSSSSDSSNIDGGVTEIPIVMPDAGGTTPTPSHRYTGSGGGGSLPSGGGYVPNPGGSGGYSAPGSGGYGGSGSGGSGSDSGGGPLSVDDGSTGYLAGGSGGSSGLGAFALGGGSAAAAAALRARTAGLGGSGGVGSGVTGSGGILGGGTGPGASGVGASDAAGTGAGAAGGRGGMMGGGGMGGGKTDKAKRAGMGGAIAPKLEDDPEYTPLPEGARAGRRATKDAGS